jgi:hypothetical protein
MSRINYQNAFKQAERDYRDGIREGDLGAWRTFFRALEHRSAQHMVEVSRSLGNAPADIPRYVEVE